MHVRRPTETTYRRRIARRLLLLCAAAVLALTTGITLATAAIAAPAHARSDRGAVHGSAATTSKPVAEEDSQAGDAGSSPVVPLVLAGIVILAAAGPWLPSPSRSGYYRIERCW
jgi:hypothetical protein